SSPPHSPPSSHLCALSVAASRRRRAQTPSAAVGNPFPTVSSMSSSARGTWALRPLAVRRCTSRSCTVGSSRGRGGRRKWVDEQTVRQKKKDNNA
ncbi:hypothetical protein T310_9085, partial [Rasamsonia emersonii CBS 393.64]